MTWRDLFARALDAHRSGDTASARSLYQAAAEQGADPAPPRLLALMLAEEGQADAARRWALRALALDPEDTHSHAALGRVLAVAGAWPEAVVAFRAAVARDASNVVALDGLGRALLAGGDAAGACDATAAALRLRPGDRKLRRLHALALRRAASISRAAAAVAAFPDAGEIGQVLGQMLFAAGRVTEAAAAFARAAAHMPEDAAIHHDLGTALHEAGRPAEAAAAYRAALALAPGRVDSWHNLGSSLQATGALAAALAAYGRAYALDPASFPRIAQELAAGNPGQVWLRAASLRAALRHSIDGP